ncbi:alpha/beta fold hydrolase [Methylobacterium durans]|uniref:alpha/beta hydrolase family protein n=1 Tax=Methylobacterium durans TaxID=2202825 RepID=UPI002AFE145F|nr:alpha/beta fold hydrolase [Methylobacterium durans]MEA1830955.1 alpha/beta fold hydrolase [Methylobacterium durans]
MAAVIDAPRDVEATPSEVVTVRCRDDYGLRGHLWRADPRQGQILGLVVINPATGVLARYYHAYARFLAEHGFDVLTYDYRGIGASRPAALKGCGIRWRHWGELDFDAAVKWADGRRSGPLVVVGHSIGGFLPGFAEASARVDRILTIGAQYAYWPDYAAARRAHMVVKWHVVMPAVTALAGYFPGRRIGWLEDLPSGVAYEWSFRRARMEASYPPRERAAILSRFARVKAPILAVGTTDDEFGTSSAIRRALDYYTSSPRTQVQLTPTALGATTIGHFGLFHARRSGTFWTDTLDWLRHGRNPWPQAILHAASPSSCSTEPSR